MAKVFLSSTSKDLREYRAKVADAINYLPDFECIQMEDWGAVNATPADYDAVKVTDCDLFVLLVGAIYGECPPSSETSFTELEYKKALELDKPRIVFVASGKFKPDLELMDSLPPNDVAKRKAFKERVRKERIWAEFTDPHELANQVTKAILKWQEESRQAALDKFLTHTIETNSQISLRGVMQIERQVAVKLDEVYVSLKTEREAHIKQYSLSDIAGEVAQVWVDLGESQSPPIPGSRVRWIAHGEKRTEKVDLAEAVREHRRVVILGDPGAGKTTLMRFLALHFARGWRGGLPTVTDKDGNDYGQARLPILMRVAEYAEALRLNRNAKLRDCLLVPFRNLERYSDGELTRLLEEKLRRGETLLLLDGLDEVTEPSDRVLISKQIEEFVRNTHRDNRVIVTSRIVGYRQAPLGSDYQHFTLLDLEREQIEKFLNGWCLAVERFLSPETSDELIASRAKAEIDGILKSVDGNTGVKRLATNPLLLTILAMIHRNGSRLPSRRVELYELAANSLLSDWLAAKGMNSSKHISRADAAQFLWPLAYWLHSERPSGLAYEQEVEEKLCQFRSRDTGKPPDHPEVIAAVDDFLARASQSTGIFVLRAPKQFGFLHLTFQEYFAALQLTRDSLQMARRIHEARHRPRWEEPILLAIASRQSPDDADMLVRSAILAEGELAQQQGFKPSEYEDILHRDLFLAARCLADDVPVYPELRQQIVNRLCELYFDTRTPRSLIQDILHSFALLGSSSAVDDLAEILLGQLNSSETGVRLAAAGAFGWLGEKASSEKTVDSLLQLLHDSKSSDSFTPALSLGLLGQKGEDSLLQLLRESEVSVQVTVAVALGSALSQRSEKAVSEKVLDSLLQLLNDSDEHVRLIAIIAFSLLGKKGASEKVVDSLLGLLRDSQMSVRAMTVAAFGSLGEKGASEKVMGSLLQLLNNSEPHIRVTVAKAFGSLGEKAASEKVVGSLLKLLNDSEASVRSAAANALGSLGEKAAIEKVVNSLLQLLNDSEVSVRSATANALGLLGEKAASEKVVGSLLQLLNDSEASVRSAAANAFGLLGEKAASEKVVGLLLQLLSDSEVSVRSAVACAFGLLSKKAGNEKVQDSLTQLLNDVEASARSATANAFGSMGEKAASEKVIDSLVQLLNDSDEDVRSAAVKSLGELATLVKEDVQLAIIKLTLPLARNKRRGEKNGSKREAGYVMLRNLLAEKRSDGET